MSTFFHRIYEMVALIPYGKVLSYGQIARFLGSPRSSRLVGWAMHHCPKGLPWHRVIKQSGEIPFHEGSMEYVTQRECLEREGVAFSADGTIDMDKFEWRIDLPG